MWWKGETEIENLRNHGETERKEEEKLRGRVWIQKWESFWGWISCEYSCISMSMTLSHTVVCSIIADIHTYIVQAMRYLKWDKDKGPLCLLRRWERYLMATIWEPYKSWRATGAEVCPDLGNLVIASSSYSSIIFHACSKIFLAWCLLFIYPWRVINHHILPTLSWSYKLVTQFWAENSC